MFVQRRRVVRGLRLVVPFLGFLGSAVSSTLAAEPLRVALRASDDAIEVDARLDEASWASAAKVDLAYETRPGDNIEPVAHTEMWVTYDTRHLYVAFRAHDPDPAAIRARLADRDRAREDDQVGISVDPFNDERRAFQFRTNPLGVQLDAFFDDVGGNEDSSWDAIWDSAGRLTDFGYVVEMAIPFSSLRFPPQSGPQTWGFEGIRLYPRANHHTFRSEPRDRDRSCAVCQFSKMTGFEGISPGKNLEINPTLTGNRTDSRPSLGASDFESGSVEEDLGLTVRWGFTPGLTLDATINPDFSQIEADSAQLEVNNQFALFFPERRPFFLEGVDFFETPFNVVHTRQIADPDYGVKLTGKQGKNAMGVFYAQDEATNLVLPGSQGSRTTQLAGEGNQATVVRYRRDIGGQSAVGMLVTDRQGDDGAYMNRVIGVDGLFRVTGSDTFRVQALESETRYPTELARDFGQPGGAFRDEAYRIAYNHNSRGWNGYATYESVGTDFRADLGFMPRGDRRFWVAGLERRWWGDEDDVWTRIRAGFDYDVTEDQRGQELEREAEIWGNISGPMQSFLNLRVGRRSRFFSGRTFEESFRQSYFEIRPSRSFFFGMFLRSGDTIDFANARPADQLLFEPQISLNLGRRTSIRLDHTFNELKVEGGTLFTANLSELRVVYQLNRRTFVRLISQFLDLERNPDLFRDPVDAKAQDLLNELLFSYKLNPRTVLFVGYADNHQADDLFGLTQTDRRLFLKLGYAWVL